MSGEKNLSRLVKEMTPVLNDGVYVFTTVKESGFIDREHIICEFKEKEGVTIVIDIHKADELNLFYQYKASWITLMIHSSLEAVGLTAIFASELATYSISCNVIAGYYHDHIFVDTKDAKKAILVLTNLSKTYD